MKAIDLHYKKENKKSKALFKDLLKTNNIADINYKVLLKKYQIGMP